MEESANLLCVGADRRANGGGGEMGKRRRSRREGVSPREDKRKRIKKGVELTSCCTGFQTSNSEKRRLPLELLTMPASLKSRRCGWTFERSAHLFNLSHK